MNMSTTIVSRHASQDTPAIGRKISGINCFSHENFKKSKLWETPVNQHSQSGPFLLHFHGNKWCEELIPKGTIGQNRQLSGSLSFFVPCILWWQEGAKVRAHVINRGCTICKDIKVNLVQCVHVTRLKGFLFLRKLWTEPHRERSLL